MWRLSSRDLDHQLRINFVFSDARCFECNYKSQVAAFEDDAFRIIDSFRPRSFYPVFIHRFPVVRGS